MPTRLLMTRYTLEKDGKEKLDDSAKFTVMMNPADFKHGMSVRYDPQVTLGRNKASPKFSANGNETLAFAIVMDATGAVPVAGKSGKPVPVQAQLQSLYKVVYQYVGELHEPPHVRLLWGSLIFFGRLTTMSVAHSLFDPSGVSLRAKVDLAFVGAMSKTEAQLTSNRSSPDLSHLIVVRDGDTLPLLCQRVYGDPAYYPDVARLNGLTDIRRLAPGTQLHFPPLA